MYTVRLKRHFNQYRQECVSVEVRDSVTEWENWGNLFPPFRTPSCGNSPLGRGILHYVREHFDSMIVDQPITVEIAPIR